MNIYLTVPATEKNNFKNKIIPQIIKELAMIIYKHKREKNKDS